MSLGPNEPALEEIGLANAYALIRTWYQAAIGAPEWASSVSPESRLLIEALPAPEIVCEVEARAVLAEVIAGRLEWGHSHPNGGPSMAAYAYGGLAGRDGEYHLDANDLAALRSSPIARLLTPVTNSMEPHILKEDS